MPPYRVQRRSVTALLVALAEVAALALDWLVVPRGYPIAAAYGVPILIAAGLRGTRTVLAAATLSLALSAGSNLVQQAPSLAVIVDSTSLLLIGLLAYRSAVNHREALAAREQAEQAHDRAEVALRQRDQFLTTVTHDLRGPLTALYGSAELLARQARRTESVDSQRVLNAMDRIESVTRRMRRLVEGLLDLAAAEEGQRLALRRAPTDLLAVVREIVVERRMADQDHEIDLRCDREALVGQWDATRLERVVDNVLGNALKYSPGDSPVEVRVWEEGAPSGEFAVVAVRDRGIGILPDDLPFIFDRFRRGSNAQTGTVGMGIGLAESREIVESHGGTIGVESQPGVGTTCTIRLPLTPAPEPAAASLAGARSGSSSSA